MTERQVSGGNYVFFGGSTGIGRAAAIALGRRGANVLIVGRGRQAGALAVEAVQAAGGTATFLAADLSTIGGVRAAAEGVIAWRPVLHGVLHTAMAGFNGKTLTADGLEFAFALQYLARAALNRALLEPLAASGDGRIVHIAGDVPTSVQVDLDDLQFERRQWTFFKAVLGSHILGFLHIQEAARLWRDRPVTIAAACVGPTKTKSMADPHMPLIMKALGLIGARPEVSAVNAVRLLTQASPAGFNGVVLRNPKRLEASPLRLDAEDAAKLWALSGQIAARHGLSLT
jgi:NAD(P)-dependent dehydrogenase (short-subunit alcohol dehydrogenase family)